MVFEKKQTLNIFIHVFLYTEFAIKSKNKKDCENSKEFTLTDQTSKWKTEGRNLIKLLNYIKEAK